MAGPVPEISVSELDERLTGGEDLYLLDVRETWEHEKALIRGSSLIPMADVPARIREIPTDKPVVVICRSGGRSAQVTQYLQIQGIEKAVNLAGGVNAWAMEIDESMSPY